MKILRKKFKNWVLRTYKDNQYGTQPYSTELRELFDGEDAEYGYWLAGYNTEKEARIGHYRFRDFIKDKGSEWVEELIWGHLDEDSDEVLRKIAKGMNN